MKKFFLNDNNVLVLIVLNSFLILYFSFTGTETNRWLIGLDHLFTFAFVMEMVIKIATYKKEFFRSKSNVFDLFLISVSFISIPLSFDLDYLLVFRLLRLFRCFRLYKVIPNYSHLLKNFKLVLKASIGVILGIFIMIFILGVILCYFYRDVSPEHFGNPLESVYSAFALFTTENWPDITNEVAENLSPFWGYVTKYLFVIIVFVGGILGVFIYDKLFYRCDAK